MEHQKKFMIELCIVYALNMGIIYLAQQLPL